MRIRHAAIVVVAGLLLQACSGNNAPTAQTPGPPTLAPNAFRAIFNLQLGLLPYPTDLYFAGSTDGTIKNPTGNTTGQPATGAAVNTLDGFSTTAPITAPFTAPLNPATLNPGTVVVIELCLADTTAPTACPGTASPVSRVLAQGTDYSVGVATETDSGGAVLKITPLKPLKASTGPIVTPGNVSLRMGYLVILTNGIMDAAGDAAQGDADYQLIQGALASATPCASLTDPTLNQVCLLTGAHLEIAQAIGLNPANVVLTFSFSTESVDDTFDVLAATVTAQPLGVVPTGLSTHQLNPGLPGYANVYVGTIQMPYYLGVPSSANPTAPLTQYWVAAGPSPVPVINQSSRNLTRFNPVPALTTTLTIPLLVTVPNATARGGAGCPKPATGYPVVIMQHGITRNRLDALAIADSFAQACFALAAIDLPLHGITDKTNPFYQAGHERTFDLDLDNSPGGIDPSGTWYINLTSPLTSRDNNREAAADLLTLAKSLPSLKFTTDPTPDIDAANIHYLGHSLGAIVGGVFVEFAPVTTATLANPGGGLAQLVLDSATFGPLIVPGAEQLTGSPQGTTKFYQYFRDFQAVLDSGDPINHLANAVATHPVHLIRVDDDLVVPNNSTDRLVLAAGLQALCTPGPHPVGAGHGAYVSFLPPATHGSLLDPTASLGATVEMQTETVDFAASAVVPGGPFVVISNPAVVDASLPGCV